MRSPISNSLVSATARGVGSISVFLAFVFAPATSRALDAPDASAPAATPAQGPAPAPTGPSTGSPAAAGPAAAPPEAPASPPVAVVPVNPTATPTPTTGGEPAGAAPSPSSPKLLGLPFVEQLPPEGYPEPKIRGLRGGSLWLTMNSQGYQWPYMPQSGIALSGYGWVDNSFQRIQPGESQGNGVPPVQGSVNSKLYREQARVLLRVTPTWTNGDYFVQAQAELVATQLATPSSGVFWTADDAWVRVGKWNVFDLQFGRFEFWEVYHFGMGMDLFTFERNGAANLGPVPGLVPDQYGLTSSAPMFYRNDVIGQSALHIYARDWLRFEVGAHYGAEANGTNALGIRPVAFLDFGALKLKAEYQVRDEIGAPDNSKLATRQQGFGGSVNYIYNPIIEGGVNFEWSFQDTRNDRGEIVAGGTFHQYTIGGFVNARLFYNFLVGAGLHYSFREDTNFDPNLGRNENGDHWQPFVAVQYKLFDQLYIKAVGAYALADVNPIPVVQSTVYRNETFSARLRFQYYF
jgi:hypothetical protein